MRETSTPLKVCLPPSGPGLGRAGPCPPLAAAVAHNPGSKFKASALTGDLWLPGKPIPPPPVHTKLLARSLGGTDLRPVTFCLRATPQRRWPAMRGSSPLDSETGPPARACLCRPPLFWIWGACQLGFLSPTKTVLLLLLFSKLIYHQGKTW